MFMIARRMAAAAIIAVFMCDDGVRSRYAGD